MTSTTKSDAFPKPHISDRRTYTADDYADVACAARLLARAYRDHDMADDWERTDRMADMFAARCRALIDAKEKNEKATPPKTFAEQLKRQPLAKMGHGSYERALGTNLDVRG